MTREHLCLPVILIEKTRHWPRRQDALSRMTPVRCETLNQAAHASSPPLPHQLN
ncbi:protein of unknown function [Modestobacter italicus]|uniref:Uncharacterized protein n=1 Tax=Modestobacter italicus (strain DSM 44449 / CECT 9708 / BC 501) TaxID=2732864 RepID=I4F0U4_MODI5|nr:protein of unknown function [Modestobacter marinus]